MAHPVVALLTDFGLRDHYVGAMKGAMLSICPDLTLVDISHEIDPHDVAGAAVALGAAYTYFPPETIFLAVVDPGVGTSRRGIAVEAGNYRFVAPDNGVLSAVLDGEPSWRAVELSSAAHARPSISRTFEGRDRFGPAAAWLASGVDLSALGPELRTLTRIALPAASVGEGMIRGEVLSVDRFGNLVTNIDRAAVDTLGGASPEVRVGNHRVGRLVTTYADIAPGEVCALFGSNGRLEIATSGGSASRLLSLGRGAPVQVVRGA